MKRNGGLAAGFLAVLTLVGVSNLPNRSPQSPAAPGKFAVPSARTAPASTSPKPYAPCTEIAKRLRRLTRDASKPAKDANKPVKDQDKTVKDPDKPVDQWALPGSCYESDRPPGLETVHTSDGVQFAIATLPNPVSTHLSLLFDRLVETIQQAAQDDNYSYDSSWFPWDTTTTTYPLLVDQKKAEDLQEIQQSQPGVMVFRRAVTSGLITPYQEGLVILVVGEQPTGGISDDQFKNALAWIDQMGGRADGELRIVGPTFSGSIPSLRRELYRDRKSYTKLSIYSGTVSSGDAAHGFDEWIKKLAAGSYFRTAMESDSVMVNRFCQYLNEQSYDVQSVALLSEDETAFGFETQSPCGQAMSLYYPRDIATLRSAYEQQSIFNPPKPEPNANAPTTTLRGDLSEPSTNDHDTVRSYGGQLTPLAQESILLDITNRLKERRIQFIILRSTSSLDQIFLSQFLRRTYPEGRVVIDGADLLFNRGAEGKSLRGVMLLSTYPLLTAEQDWTPSLLNKSNGSYRAFGEDTAEGTYIAARALFRRSVENSEVPIHDYGPPAWAVGPRDNTAEDQRPATWLTVIARRRFWPLAALNSNTLNRGALAGTLQPFLTGRDGIPISDGEASPLYLPTAMWMFLLACILWSVIHFYFCSNGSILGWPRARAYFAPVPKCQHPALLGFGSALLAMLAVAVAGGSGLFSWLVAPYPFRDPFTATILAILLLTSFTFAVLACRKNFALNPVRASDSPVPNARYWQSVTVVTAILALAAFVLVQIYMVHKLTQANRIPAYWRSVNFLSGVSGMLPEILLIAGAYLWFWFNLRGLAHFGEDRPRLPKVADLPRLEDGTPMMPMFSQEYAGTLVEQAALPLTQRYLWRLSMVFAITVIVSWVALERAQVRTLGELLFGQFIFWWVCLSIAVILTDGMETWRAWNELRQLLIYLDRLPLRRTLRALKGLAWGSIWKMSGNVLEERYRAISLQVESLRHLTNTLTAWDPDSPSAAEGLSELLAKIGECQKQYLPFVKWFVTLQRDEPVTDLTYLNNFQVQLTAVAGMVMKTVLVPAWRNETESLIFGRENPDEKSAEDKPAALDIPTKEIEPHVRAAEEFFVLPYLAFIQNILGRIRTIALGSLWLFLGTTLAISSYPFDPLSVLGAIFLAVFLLVGGVTVLVYSQMSRDATLSHITNTLPGQLGWDFWLRLVGFGVGPLIGLLTTLFPSITDFAFSWLEPSVQALK
jgi:hypothetical protein